MNRSESDFQTLLRCKSMIEADLEWGPSTQWNTRDFDNLSDKIYEKTDTRISATTLKRIWGRVQYNSFPSASTLDVLANFLGLPSWRAFQKETLDRGSFSTAPRTVFSRHRSQIIALIVAFLIFGGLIFRSAFPLSARPGGEVLFQSEVVSTEFPRAVKFLIDSIQSDRNSLVVRLHGDDKKVDVKLPENEREVFSMYYYPGVYRAKLMDDEEVIREKDIVLRSESWLTTFSKGFAVDYFQEAIDPQFQGLRLRPSFIDSMGSAYFLEKELMFHLTPPFINFVGDHFTVETTLAFPPTGDTSHCRSGRITLLGNDHKLIVPFSDSSCKQLLELKFGDNEIFTSADHDLAALQMDLNRERHLKLEIHNKTLTIHVDEMPVAQIPFKNGPGRIMGIRFGLEGDPRAEVRQLTITDHSNTRVVYSF